jgi:hypothetical protein
MRRELVNRQREEPDEAEAEAETDEKADIDSIDSPYAHVVLPCSCDSPMLMTFPHAHEVLLCEREGVTRVY